MWFQNQKPTGFESGRQHWLKKRGKFPSPVRYCWQPMDMLDALANDPHVWIPKWCRRGWNLGIVHLPAVDKATAAVEESTMYGRVLVEHPVHFGSAQELSKFSVRHNRKTTWTVSSVASLLENFSGGADGILVGQPKTYQT